MDNSFGHTDNKLTIVDGKDGSSVSKEALGQKKTASTMTRPHDNNKS